MLIFSILGIIFIFFSTKDLYTAVIVNETAATFLTSTFILRIIFNISVSKVSLIISFVISIFGSIIYYLESQNINNLLSSIFELDHKYKTLLFINIIIIFINFSSVLINKRKNS